jgi:predicted alternative tryptophan synthase beta-subunit
MKVSARQAVINPIQQSPRPTTTKRRVSNAYHETGAGQWGSALSFACMLFGLELKVYMVKVSYNQKPYRRIMMETWGAKVFSIWMRS